MFWLLPVMPGPCLGSPGSLADRKIMGVVLNLYTIYKDPLDFPGKYVVRLWEAHPPIEDPLPQHTTVFDSLDEARASLPPGLYNLGRFDADEPQIVETWV